jgi:hypothetical protein
MAFLLFVNPPHASSAGPSVSMAIHASFPFPAFPALTAFLHLWQNPGRAAKEGSYYCYRPDTRSGRM